MIFFSLLPTDETQLDRMSPEEGGRARLRPARAKASFHPLSRELAQSSGFKRRLPFSMGVIPLL